MTATPSMANCSDMEYGDCTNYTEVNMNTTEMTRPFIPAAINWPRITILSCVMIFGILANGSLIFIVLKNSFLRKTQNILFVNLMVGDLVCLLINVPFVIEYELMQGNTNVRGDFMCKFTTASLIMSACVVVYSLVALSIERYQKIADPFNRCGETCCSGSFRRCSIHSNGLIIAAIWICSFIVAAPVIVLAEYKINGCKWIAHHTDTAKIYKVFRAVTTFIIPFIMIVTVHIIIACTLLKSIRDPVVRNSELNRSLNGSGRQNRRRSPRIRSRVKIAVVVTVLSAMFFVAQLPGTIVNILFEFKSSLIHSPSFVAFYRWARIPFYVLCCFNPIMMYILSSRFRKQLILDCCFPCRSPFFRRISMRLSQRTTSEQLQLEPK
ncbi:melanin-concentrating hormone receptor 1-like [Strongylocentrotus purpuratus]|uniref:G-protein coupled receptors family 1 profile domain-containing protein n=1 Tax=Strongylocentrotus purpuratus TaxID=7668 RepID=A0A7M7NIY9_STRPU|nr:melanin-concentrating hormone receptor 1-like [Strongylocentrotus purpuratus]|eukprot:XP_011665051.1 PREDICTED: melanin-concentrating hormone receptor 1-like [Strongylocentrotus purpuratus]